MVSLSMVFRGPPKLEDEEMFIRIGDDGQTKRQDCCKVFEYANFLVYV